MAGQDRANPIGTILSAAMLMRSSLGRTDVAEAIESAVSEAIDDGYRTGDLVMPGADDRRLRRVGTRAMTAAIGERVAAGAPGRRDGSIDDDAATMVAADTLLGLP
jgi:3-isopropylmalate dehydrogenase